jgi:hypothetical protein
MLAPLKRFLGDMYFLTQARAIHEVTRLTPDAKRDLLSTYGAKYDIFIETGTYFGLTAGHLASAYKEIHTIEIDRALYENARQRLQGFGNVHCYHGDSAAMLREILANVDRPAVFWLDAHYTGGITARSDSDTPVLQELAVVFSHPVDTHLILIDDARWFVGRNGYPGVRKLHALVRASSPYDMCIHDDIIRIFRDDEWTQPESFLSTGV